MDKKIKRRWIEALRSGEYKQSKIYLKSERGFCCLGVLCDLYSKETGTPWEEREYEKVQYFENQKAFKVQYFQNQKAFLPIEVMDWANLQSQSPQVVLENKNLPFTPEGNSERDLYSLTYVNDEGFSFNQIADAIEKDLAEDMSKEEKKDITTWIDT